MRRVRDWAVLAASGVLALLIAGHALVPDVAGVGTLLDSAAPWLGLVIPIVVVVGLALRTRATAAALVPVLVWCGMFGANLIPHASAASGELRVVSQNLYADNDDPAATAADLAATSADVIGVQELTGAARKAVGKAFDEDHPHHETIGTVGLWSRFPVDRAEPVDLGLGWTRAMRARVRTPQGAVEIYVAHLPSLRPDTVDQRNRALSALAEALISDDSRNAIVLGDLNTASTDRAMGLLPAKARPAHQGFAFTWPANAPMVRLDHVLFWGVRPTATAVVRTRGADHRAVLADFAFEDRAGANTED